MAKNIEKDSALEQVLADIEKQFGKGAIMKLGEQEHREIEVSPSGSLTLDIALGAGGSSKLVFDHGKRIERVENVKDVSNYISRIDEMIQRKRTAVDKWL